MKLSNLLQEISIKLPLVPPVGPVSPSSLLKGDGRKKQLGKKIKKKEKDEGELSFADVFRKTLKKDEIDEIENEDFDI